MIKMYINYETGEEDGRGIDFMCCTEWVCAREIKEREDFEEIMDAMYAYRYLEESDLDDDGMETDEADDRHYEEMVEELTEKAAEFGIRREEIHFYRDL